MLKQFTCIICPNGCEIQALLENRKIKSLSGALCKKGEAYVRQELAAPVRNIASSVLVSHGRLPLVSVRLTAPIPKDRVFDAMREIRKIHLDAPVRAGQVVIPHLLGLNSDVIATKHVPAKETPEDSGC